MSELEQPKRSQIGPEAFLSAEERKALQRSLSFPEDLPPKFRSFLIDFIAVNIPQISIRSIVGFDRFVYNRGTVFPVDPSDGQMFGYQVDANTVWQFRFDSGIADAYKWVFTGGSPLAASVNTSETRTGTSAYGDLATVGPSVTTPRTGIYEIIFGSNGALAFTGANVFISPHYGATPLDAEAASVGGPNASGVACSRGLLITITAASQLVKLQYRISSGADTGTFSRRWLILRPVRVS